MQRKKGRKRLVILNRDRREKMEGKETDRYVEGSSVAEPEPEPEPPEPYHFDPRRTGTGTVSLL
jgi:hypothetical protein